jgi:diaminopimelate epimerase
VKLNFYKYHGTGNDFVIIDNRDGSIMLTEKQIALLCDRRFGIGADGLMMLQLKDGYDFQMYYVNSDGKPSSMCGNGSRCLVQFAHDVGLKKQHYRFLAVDGEHEAEFSDTGWVRVKMNDVSSIKTIDNISILNTGSPHFIKPVNNVASLDVFSEGRNIRYSERFKEEGINVNFVEQKPDGIFVRTYERGVEDETFSCGTGVTAAALAFSPKHDGRHRIDIETKGGKLAVEFEKTGEFAFQNIWLCGPATFVFKGEIML